MTFDHESLTLLGEALKSLDAGFAHLPETAPGVDRDRVRAALLAAAERMRDNYPYHHPLYVGRMHGPAPGRTGRPLRHVSAGAGRCSR